MNSNFTSGSDHSRSHIGPKIEKKNFKFLYQNLLTIMGHLLFSVDGADLVDGLDGGRKATVHTKDSVVDHSRQTEAVVVVVVATTI